MENLRHTSAAFSIGALIFALSNVAGAQDLKTAQEILDFSDSKMRAYSTWSADSEQVTPMIAGLTSPQNGRIVQKAPHQVWSQLDMVVNGQSNTITTIIGHDNVLWQIRQLSTRQNIVKIDLNKVGHRMFSEGMLGMSVFDQAEPLKQWKTLQAKCRFTLANGAELEDQRMYVLDGTWQQSALTNDSMKALATMVEQARSFVGCTDGFVHRIEYWDRPGMNLVAAIEFRNVKFNQYVADSTFIYQPPADAEVRDMTKHFADVNP